jgi:hypothetical protein
MEKLNCRSHEQRLRICEMYELTPILRTQLLKGVTMPSDAGALLSKEYFIFSAKDRQTGVYHQITVGSSAAKDFLTITGKQMPNYFQMLKRETNSPSQNKGKSAESRVKESAAGGEKQEKKEWKWNPLHEQLYQAVCILIVAWGDTSSNSLLYRELQKCEKYHTSAPYEDRILRINAIISKDYRKTLQGILESLRKKGNPIRDFDFQMLHESVLSYGQSSNIYNISKDNAEKGGKV